MSQWSLWQNLKPSLNLSSWKTREGSSKKKHFPAAALKRGTICMAVGTFMNLDCKEAVESGFQGLDSGFFVGGTSKLVFNCWVGFCCLWAVFWIPTAKISWNPDSKIRSFLDYGIWNPSSGAKGISRLGEGRFRFSWRCWKLTLCYCIRRPHNEQTVLTLHCVGHVLWLNEQAIVRDAKCLVRKAI